MFDQNRLKDPGYFSENRLPAHSDHLFFATREEMEAGKSSLRVSLNGTWKFFHAMNPAQVLPGFEQPEFDCAGWEDIRVPGHIQTQGWGVPQYCNTQYPWNREADLRPGQLPEEFNPVACYVRTFRLPRDWEGKRVFVSFQGAESCVAVWLNGEYIGFTSDSFTPHDFELTQALREGENKLACRVYRFCAGSWLEDQDFLRFSGLFREVFLWAAPAAHLRDWRMDALPDPETGCGTLSWKAGIDAPKGTELSLRLKQGSAVLAEETRTLEGGEEESGSLTVDHPRLWSAEDPWLYDLEIRLKAPDGTEEWIPQRVGFRRIEIRNAVIRVNGVRVVFKGVNRHDFCGETGRAVTEEGIRRDLILMKRNNINAVRTSHYPNHSALYRLCDELGLYVIDENNMETHGMWDMLWQGWIPETEMFPGNQKAWEPLLLDRVRSMVSRDRNHPSVVIWSCGNESLTGSVILEMHREMKRLDPTRPVHYEGDMHLPEDRRIREVTDIESEMYTPAAKVREYLKTHREKPFILCEYTHSMGNSNGGMHLYTELAYEEERYQGGFIWDFKDQALVSRDRFGRETLLYGGDWDDRPHDGIFCGNGIAFADGKGTPKLQEVKYLYQNIVVKVERDRAEIQNRHMFLSTGAFRCMAVLERNGVEVERLELETDVPPLSSAIVPLSFEKAGVPGEYAATLSFRLKKDTPWAEAGYEVAFGQGIWTVAETRPAAEEPGEALKIADTAWNITIRGASFEVMFSRSWGQLISYRVSGRELVKDPLRPNFWRAPINNDNGNKMPARCAQWKIASLYADGGAGTPAGERNAKAHPRREADGSVTLNLAYWLPTTPEAWCDAEYRVLPSGRLEVTLRYDPAEGLPEPPEFGMIMKLDADYHRVRYYGLGPEENYIDRRSGAKLGIWEYRAEENLTPYLLPQECGNRTGVRWAEITDAAGRGLRVLLNGGEFSALPWTPHELENAAHGFELPPVCYTVLKMSARQMGVGGDNSWGARTLDEYLLDVSQPLVFRFALEGC
ncbi:MAG: DUF4981 domain-containing protein [Clostridia bacterium]|nr:DUF4981 domain-containing protein [Clostridia bacterium]